MGVVHNDAAYMPIGSQFIANINISASKKDADLEIDKSTLKLPEIWHGLSPERVKEAVNLDAIVPQLKEEIAKAAANQPTMTEFVAKLTEENVGLKAQVQTGGRINGITYLYEGQAIKASLIEMSWKNLAAMGVNYDPERDREALTTPTNTVQTETNPQSESLMESQKSSTANPLEKIESQLRESVHSHFDSEQPVKITGNPVKMVYPLKMHGEANLLPVNTCIEAMRGYGRCHTTRRYEPYAAYGFKEGDIAIAIAGEQKVAFKVGKQYKITPEMLNDAAYQQQWSQMEKHSAKELTTFQGHSNTWGMHFQPLGDYVNGKIMPFPTEPIKADNTIVADIQQLMEWSRIAEYLGKSEKYIDRIQELIAGESITEKAQQAMHKDHQSLSQHVASQWREILAINSDYVESQDGKLVFERKGNEGKYRATWEQDTDTLTLDTKVVNQGEFQYSPLLVQQGLEVTHSQVTVKDAKNCDRALQLIAESQKEYQESR